MTRPVVVGAALLLLAATGTLAVPDRGPGFPHRSHTGLFPSCLGCHEGVETGGPTDPYPTPGSCESCHDGVIRDRVDWRSPDRAPSMVRFDHVEHGRSAASSGEERPECEACHRETGATERMAVVTPSPETCVACHDPGGSHLEPGAPCTQCHAPIASATSVPTARIAGFPRPEDHAGAPFLSRHGIDAVGDAARCAVCHARQSCERCHANSDAVPAIAALQPDDRIAALVAGKAAEYGEPASHETSSWTFAHGAAARTGADACANCHARPGCAACHGASEDALFARLPVPRPDGPAGVVPVAAGRVHGAGFDRQHGTAAGSAGESCGACHRASFCADCHDAPAAGFHAPNFSERHGPAVYGGEAECSSCHSVEVFCRACHDTAGRASAGRVERGYHDAKPYWLLGHGRAARQSLESCVGCHAQTDCTRCHSSAGGWGVSPHGAGFDGSRDDIGQRVSCRQCHAVPPGGP